MLTKQESATRYLEKKRYIEEHIQTHIRSILTDIIDKRPENVLDHIIAYCEKRLNIKSVGEIRQFNRFETDEPMPDPLARPQPSMSQPEQLAAPIQPVLLKPIMTKQNSSESKSALIPGGERRRSTKGDARVSFKEPTTVVQYLKTIEEVSSLAPSSKVHESEPSSRRSSFDNNSEEEVSDSEFEKRIMVSRRETNPTQFRFAVSAEASNKNRDAKNAKVKVTKKAENEREMIMGFLNSNFLFSQLELSDKELLVDAMETVSYRKGKIIIKQGDIGNHLYIVSEGFLRCTKVDPETQKETFLINYVKGNVFGELSLLYNTPRAATIEAQTDAVVYALDRETFNAIVRTSVIKRHELFAELVKKVDFLQSLSQIQRDKICDCLMTEDFKKGDYVIAEGDEANKIYFLLEGNAETLKKSANGVNEKVFEFGPNDYFGELALINNNKRSASIRITSKTAKVASLDKDSFFRLLGNIQETLRTKSKKYEKQSSSKGK